METGFSSTNGTLKPELVDSNEVIREMIALLWEADQIFNPLLQPNLTAPAWGFASAGQSLRRMATACGLPTTPRAAQLFLSSCPPRSGRTHNLPTCSQWPTFRCPPVTAMESETTTRLINTE